MIYRLYADALLSGRALEGRVVAQDGLVDWDDDDDVAD
jgi:hypothetical protein